MAQQWMTDVLDSLEVRMRAAGRVPLGYRKDGRAIWPILGAEDAPENPVQPPPLTPPAAPTVPSDLGYPLSTPLEQMTGEQRENYWKHQAKKHEGRVKSLGGLTPEELSDLRAAKAERDAAKAENATVAEKLASQAAEQAAASTREQLRPALIEARLDAAAARAGVSDEALRKAVEFIDVQKFLASDGTVDTDKVSAFVASIAPVMGSQQQAPKGPVVVRHGAGVAPAGSQSAAAAAGSVASGRDLYRSRRGART